MPNHQILKYKYSTKEYQDCYRKCNWISLSKNNKDIQEWRGGSCKENSNSTLVYMTTQGCMVIGCKSPTDLIMYQDECEIPPNASGEWFNAACGKKWERNDWLKVTPNKWQGMESKGWVKGCLVDHCKGQMLQDAFRYRYCTILEAPKLTKSTAKRP